MAAGRFANWLLLYGKEHIVLTSPPLGALTDEPAAAETAFFCRAAVRHVEWQALL